MLFMIEKRHTDETKNDFLFFKHKIEHNMYCLFSSASTIQHCFKLNTTETGDVMSSVYIKYVIQADFNLN